MLQNDSDPALSERQRKMVDEAAKSCSRLVALINELSELGKFDGDTVSVELQPFDLFSELDEVAKNVHEGKDRDVELKLSGQAAGAKLTSDRKRLSAAFAAIFRALLREQPTAITMIADRRIVRADEATSAVVVVAREADVQRTYAAAPQAFDEFRGGIGLSLPIARRVIERAGGQIWSPTPADANDRGSRSAAIISIPLPE